MALALWSGCIPIKQQRPLWMRPWQPGNRLPSSLAVSSPGCLPRVASKTEPL